MPERDQNADFDDQPTIPPRVADRDTANDGQTILPQSSPSDENISKPPSLSIPQIQNYEILDELGRGGMGVVYKARDTQLDRLVALKMILGGKFASEEEIQRFRIEGESAARLDHPGIVPIYEIEQVDGNHFFSMKFVEGDSLLNRLDDYKPDQRAACELVAKIADAVQHAHQRAVLHRDLKPANVLIDRDGQPSITDFGLAKRTDGESELTATGLVMGTPGFMSPEQAAGRKDITAATDVFSLGAILYWTITGEAPFQGETRIQAVMKTIEGELSSIRNLAPNASSDLELVCQKAMHKDPLQRYSSAAALAEDLRSWLDGEPLSVRRATAMNVASIWVRKNLRTVLAACLTGVFCGLVVGGIIAISELKDAAQTEYDVLKLGSASKTWVSNFGWLRGLSDSWSVLQYLMVPALAGSAFVCVLLVKPKTREANIASAVTSGLIASAIAFLISGGWGVMSYWSVDEGTRDIEILSTAMWLESDGERKLAQRALIERYPGLKDMDTANRQQVIRRKILHQQTAGLTPGLWMGVLITILFVGLPLTLTCVLSGVLWRQGIRGWQWFGCTWERSAYLLIFFLLIALWLRPIRPSTLLMLACLGSLLVALAVAVRMSHWFWRVVMIPIPFVCMALVQSDHAAMNQSMYRAGNATSDSELRKQLLQGERLFSRVERSFDAYRSAIGWLHLEEEEKHQLRCRELISTFEYAYRPGIASRLAKVCLLQPGLQRPEDIELAYELSAFASGFESDEDWLWFCATRALTELRRGNFEAALDWNKKSRNEEASGHGYKHAITHAVDALAWIELGEKEKAQDSLAFGRRMHEEHRKKEMSDGNDSDWHDGLVFKILEKEVLSNLE